MKQGAYGTPPPPLPPGKDYEEFGGNYFRAISALNLYLQEDRRGRSRGFLGCIMGDSPGMILCMGISLGSRKGLWTTKGLSICLVFQRLRDPGLEKAVIAMLNEGNKEDHSSVCSSDRNDTKVEGILDWKMGLVPGLFSQW